MYVMEKQLKIKCGMEVEATENKCVMKEEATENKVWSQLWVWEHIRTLVCTFISLLHKNIIADKKELGKVETLVSLLFKPAEQRKIE